MNESCIAISFEKMNFACLHCDIFGFIFNYELTDEKSGINIAVHPFIAMRHSVFLKTTIPKPAFS